MSTLDLDVKDPVKSYRKTIRGKLHVTVLDPYTSQPRGVLMCNDPRGTNEVGRIVELWSPREVRFFEEFNRNHIRSGNLVVHTKEVPKEKSPNEITDEEVDELLNQPFLALKNALDKFTNVAPVYMIKERAVELDKSEKLISHIDSKIAQLQLEEYEPVEE